MKVFIISGSQRQESQSGKVARWLAKALAEQKHEADIIDMADHPLPLWDDAMWDAKSDLSAQAKPYQDRASAADAVILVSAEWDGMVPSGLKNFLLYLKAKQVGHKPCLLVGVSASRGGSYPIAELRMSGYKNNRLLYIPEHLIVQDVKNVMNSAKVGEGSDADQYIKKRAHYALEVLMKYAAALKPMREAGILSDAYPNGM